MGITKGGVYYDLDESNFEYRITAKNDDVITFVFSSMSHLNKFEEQLNDFIYWFNTMITRKCGISPHMRGYPAIVLYSRIETRGFKIYWRGCYRSLMEVENRMKEGVLNG